VSTLERWRADALSAPTRERVRTAAARLQAVIATAAMDEAQRSTWCRENGVYPTDLQQWKENATAALSEAPEERVTAQQSRDAKRRIKELERDLRRKDRRSLRQRPCWCCQRRVGVKPCSQNHVQKKHLRDNELAETRSIYPVASLWTRSHMRALR
jgi:transposase